MVPFTRASAVAPFVSFLASIGAPTARWLRQTRIPDTLLEDPESLVPLVPAYRLVEIAVRKEGIPELGRIVAEQSCSFDLGAYGQALRGSSSIGEYLHDGVRLISGLSTGTRLWLTAEGRQVRVNQHVRGPAGLGRGVADVYTLVLTLNTLRRFLGPDWCPGEIRLLAGTEPLLGGRDAFGDSRLIADQPHSSFTVPDVLLAWQVPRGGDDTEQPAPTRIGGPPPMPANFVGSMERLIESLADDGYPGFLIAAEAAGVSPRTLQRRLSDAGVTYSDLVAAGRIRRAKDWLRTTDMPVTEVAAALGYSDASNFARAFRRRTGISPASYRRNQARD